MKKYAFFDVDNTIYRGYSTSDFYLWLVDQNYIGEWVVEEDKKIGKLYWSGSIDYKEASIRVVSLLARALTDNDVDLVRVWQKNYIQQKDCFFPWVKEVFSLLEKKNFKTYLISAAGQPVVEAVAEALQIDKFFASEYEIIDGKFTGKVIQMLNFKEKRKLIHRIVGHIKNKSFIVACGDSTGDIEMLKVANQAFVLNPHQKEMKEIAKKNKWRLTTNKKILKDIKKSLAL